MRTLAWTVCVVLGLLIPGQAQTENTAKKQIRVLFVTGCDIPRAHEWRKTTPVYRDHLEKTGQFEVVVCEDPLVLESSGLSGYDVIILSYFNWNRPTISDQAKENLLNFVKGGKGLVSLHFTANAFSEWKEYRNLIGRIWTKGSGHGPRGTFKVKVKNKDHYITEGLGDFEADDELYAKLVGDAKINVLVDAASDWSKRVEPIAWTLPYGKGRVFNCVLGHDAKACRNPNFAKLLQRGTAWAARADKKEGS